MNQIDYKSLIFNPKSDKVRLIGQIKATSDINKIYRSISGHPFVKNLVKANAKSYRDIRSARPVSLSNIKGEIIWELLNIEKNAQVVRLFLSKKSSFDKSLLLGDCDKTEQLLSEIEATSGKSVWSIENRFIVTLLRYCYKK